MPKSSAANGLYTAMAMPTITIGPNLDHGHTASQRVQGTINCVPIPEYITDVRCGRPFGSFPGSLADPVAPRQNQIVCDAAATMRVSHDALYDIQPVHVKNGAGVAAKCSIFKRGREENCEVSCPLICPPTSPRPCCRSYMIRTAEAPAWSNPSPTYTSKLSRPSEGLQW